MSSSEPIHVVVAMDFSDEIIDQLRDISPRLHIERLTQPPERAWAQAEILYTLNTLPLPEQTPRLRWIQFHTAGMDHLRGHAILSANDITLTTTSGLHAVNMTEYCLGMILALNYKIPEMLRFQAKSEWSKDRYKVFTPLPLRGRTLGIVGYGAIGRELARAADALGMTVLAMKRDVMHPAETGSYREPGTGDPAGEIPARIYPPAALGSMAAACDVLVLITPLTDQTRDLVDSEVLRGMKKTALLIDLARGGVVDETALLTALKEGWIAGAALDVFETEPLPPESPLWSAPNLIISPHIAGYRADYHARAADVFAANLRRYLDDEPLFNVFARELGY
ncbi:MAG: D-2-hydroxyacid dehydrogenase [Anaerolineae bacterium]|nr:D-2-hydroxyacid dehydrogenase [Anaerolineae bacterium]NUQ06186.1 D-2-hydroxyacid dehydrogenase [Anaerolineae bacterium]